MEIRGLVKSQFIVMDINSDDDIQQYMMIKAIYEDAEIVFTAS